MMKLKLGPHGFEAEVDVVSLVVTASQQFRFFRKKGILGKLKEPITLVTSNLYAAKQGTKIITQEGQFQATPLLKLNRDGTAMPIMSGFLVTGIYDSFGQIQVASALSRLGVEFKISYDMDPDIDKNNNLICFGSPSSNILSRETFDSLESVLSKNFHWNSGYNSFTIQEISFKEGDDGVVLFYDSPWDSDRKVLVLAGLGPMGTLACCKTVSEWNACIVSRKQKKASNFIVAVKYSLLNRDYHG